MILTVELTGTKQGNFLQEFWIKCDPHCRVQVFANFIIPALIPHHPNTTRSFTMIDFPRTYFGTKIMKTLAVQNYCATETMYCIKAEVDGKRLVILDYLMILETNYLHKLIIYHT